MKKAIIWVRTSTLEQEADTQKEFLVEWAKSLGYDELNIIGTKGASAIKADEQYRAEINELLSTLETTGIKCVFCREVSRLSRRLEYFNKIIEYLEKNKVQLYCHTPEIKLFNDDGSLNSGGEMALHILSVVAKQEMEIKNIRFGEKKARMRKQGKLTEGKPLFGYRKLKDGTVEENPEEADIVRWVINTYANSDMSINKLSLVVIGKFFPNMVRSTAFGFIQRCINNLAYSGENTKTKVNYPPIVNSELQRLAIAKCKHRRSEFKQDTKYIYFCKGIIRNKKSGKALVANRCNCTYQNLPSDLSKEKIYISINAMDSLAWDIAKRYYIMEFFHKMNIKKEDYKRQIDENNAQIKTIEGLVDNIQSKRRNAQKQLINGRVSDDIYDEQNKIWNKDEKAYAKQIAELKSMNAQYKSYLDQSIKVNDDFEIEGGITMEQINSIKDDNERRNIVKEMIKTIWVEKIENEYKINIDLNVGLGYYPRYFYYRSIGGKMHLYKETVEETEEDHRVLSKEETQQIIEELKKGNYSIFDNDKVINREDISNIIETRFKYMKRKK